MKLEKVFASMNPYELNALRRKEAADFVRSDVIDTIISFIEKASDGKDFNEKKVAETICKKSKRLDNDTLLKARAIITIAASMLDYELGCRLDKESSKQNVNKDVQGVKEL